MSLKRDALYVGKIECPEATYGTVWLRNRSDGKQFARFEAQTNMVRYRVLPSAIFSINSTGGIYEGWALISTSGVVFHIRLTDESDPPEVRPRVRIGEKPVIFPRRLIDKAPRENDSLISLRVHKMNRPNDDAPKRYCVESYQLLTFERPELIAQCVRTAEFGDEFTSFLSDYLTFSGKQHWRFGQREKAQHKETLQTIANSTRLDEELKKGARLESVRFRGDDDSSGSPAMLVAPVGNPTGTESAKSPADSHPDLITSATPLTKIQLPE